MKSLICQNLKLSIVDKPIPTILDPRDAIVRVKYSSICTSDLHIKNGFVPNAKNGTILGHEFVGEIVEVGKSITTFKQGDRVSANCETFCGECYFCQKGFINNCSNGGWLLGCSIDGCQAEYIRVPFADTGLNKIPDNLSYKNALFVGDILSSGYFGIELCNIKKEDIVVIIGAGPVGLCSMMCARLLGANKIIAIDINSKRLDIAKEKNLTDYIFNPNNCDVEDSIFKITNNRGADCVIEAAGGKNTFEMAWKIARSNATIAIVAMYENSQIIPLPKMYGKNLTFKTGGVDAIHCKELLNLISEGKINTDFLITQTYPLENILEAYDFFEKNKNDCLKICIEH